MLTDLEINFTKDPSLLAESLSPELSSSVFHISVSQILYDPILYLRIYDILRLFLLGQTALSYAKYIVEKEKC